MNWLLEYIIRKENLSEIGEGEGEVWGMRVRNIVPNLQYTYFDFLVIEVDYLYKENISCLYFSGCFFLRILVNDFLIFY